MLMSPFEREDDKHVDSPGDTTRDAPATPGAGSSSDADDSAAHIAELVRRSAERDARPGPSSVAPQSVTAAQPPIPVAPEQRRAAGESSHQPPAPAARRRPPMWVLVAGAAVAVLLIATGFALTRPGDRAVTASPAATPSTAAPAFTVRATDTITDCAGHAHGRTKRSFEKQNCVKATRALTTGRVNGRPVLFVTSRIQMASADAAAAIKQVLDANGTGNLNDLLSEGKTFAGAPAKMPSSGYASVQTGAVVMVAEAGFSDGGLSSNTNPTLRAAAAKMAGK